MSAARVALLIAGSLGAAGCPNRAALPACPTAHLPVSVAVEADPDGPVYLADDFAGETGYPYAIERADTLDAILRSTDDGTALALLAPAAGGLVVVNGGAAARRFDGAGTLLWTAGYGAFLGVRAGLGAGDRLLVADAGSLWLLAPDGTVAWKRPLPDTVDEVVQVLGDGDSGYWVVGQFQQNVASWIASGPGGDRGGLFVLHVDQSGTVIGAGASGYSNNDLSRPAVASKDAAGAPMLVVRYQPNGSFPTAEAFDAAGQLLWSRPSTDRLEADGAGNLVALSISGPTLVIKRLDASGSEVATTTHDLFASRPSSVQMATAPVRGGVLVAGALYDAASCPSAHFLLRVDTPSLAVTDLPLGLR